MAPPTLQNVTPLTPRQEAAALLLAEGKRTKDEVATEVGVTRMSLARWHKLPAFTALIAEHRENFRNDMLATGFADKRLRVGSLNTVATALLTQLSESNYQTVIGVTKEGDPVEGFDGARLKEFREYLADIAEEMGERRGGSTQPINLNVGVSVTFSPAEREARAAAILARLGTGDG